MTLKAYVTGGSGFVGSRLVPALLDSGYSVTVLAHPDDRSSSLIRLKQRADLTVAEGDLRKRETIKGLEGSSYVFHLAGAIAGRNKEAFYSTNVNGTANLLSAVARECRSLKRFLLVSSLAAVGPSNEQDLGESAIACPISYYGWSKFLAEDHARSAHSPTLPITILRPGGILGGGANDIVGLVVRLAKARIALRLTGSSERLSVVQVDDVVRAIIQAAQSPQTAGRTYFIAAEPPLATNDLLGRAAQMTGRPPLLTVKLGPRSQYTLAVVAELLSILVGGAPAFSRDKWREMRGVSWTCSSQCARLDFGWEAKISLEQVLALASNATAEQSD